MIESFGHCVLLLAMECGVTTEHKVKSAWTHDISGSLAPQHVELLRTIKHIFRSNIRCQVNAGCNQHWSLIVIVSLSAESLHNLAIFRRHRHRVVCVNRVLLEMVGESSQEEFVEYTALFNVEIVLDGRVAPVRQVLGMVV